MAGIVAYGAYVPWLRLERKLIAEAWGIPGAPGEIAVANFDEDSVTMAVEATRDCILDEPEGVGGLYFASTSAPYTEKSSSTIVASVLDLAPDAMTADFGASLGAGVAALLSAVNAVDSGAADNVLVAASECRLALPKTADEQTLGDGAGAVLVGKDDVIAEIKGIYSSFDEALCTWRLPGDRLPHESNPRWYTANAYVPAVAGAVKAAVGNFGIGPDDISKVVLSAPDFRTHQQIAKALGMKDPARVQDALFAFVGGTGCAQPIMMLAAALADASPGDKILVVGGGDTFDVVLLEVTDKIKDLEPRRGVAGYLASKKNLDSYAKFLARKELVELEPVENTSSAIQMWRDRKSVLPLYGKKCEACQTVYFPPRRVCPDCHEYNKNIDWKLQRTGKLWNFIDDNLAPSPEPPTTLTISDLDGGGRIFLQMTDRNVEDTELGMDVELVFRIIHDGSNFHNYFWKIRPVR
ncbi:MAG TPA: zinc ribbon domain-containing protein [Candidatus Anoxymicrobiaceae bacterium]